jgi:hypothetical protein
MSTMPGLTTTPGVKLLLFNRKLDTMTDDEFHAYWQNVHGALVRSSTILGKTIKRYVQVTKYCLFDSI